MIDPRKLGHLASNLRKTHCGIGKPLWKGMTALLQAAVYAHDVQQDIWDFSLELRELSELGLTQSEIRWLLCKGYVEQGEEIGLRKARSRSFQKVDTLHIAPNACLVLTELGVQAALEWNCDSSDGLQNSTRVSRETLVELHHNDQREQDVVLPKWDADSRMVTFDGVIVKQFKLPSPNQVAILSAFEEEGWPARIDDPLPPRSDVDPKQRLHDTIRSINRNQRHKLLFFRGDGTGNGVMWMPRNGASTSDDETSIDLE